VNHSATGIEQAVSVLAARGQRTLVLFSGGRTRGAARAMLPGLPEECFVEVGDRAGAALRRAAGTGLAQVVFVGMIAELAELGAADPCARPREPAELLAEITLEMGGSPGLAARVAGAGTARRAYELWEAAGVLGRCGRELCRRAAGALEGHATAGARPDGPGEPGPRRWADTAGPAAQVVLVDFTGERMVGMYGRLRRGRS
jgi:cobalt-precorrin-5B (C1)-methyltransferase